MNRYADRAWPRKIESVIVVNVKNRCDREQNQQQARELHGARRLCVTISYGPQ